MKKIFILNLLLVFQIGISHGQITMQSPKFGFLGMQYLKFVTEKIGICTVDGYIYKTTDGGITWEKKGIEGVQLASLFFVNQYAGYACTISGKILKTTDGGNNFTEVYNLAYEPYTDNITIYFSSELKGLIRSESSGKIYSTTDGGLSWNQATEAKPNGAFFIQNDSVYYYGKAGTSNYEIHKTIDGGKTWSMLSNIPASSVFSIQFINSKTGYVHGVVSNRFEALYTTNDGGITWSENILHQYENPLISTLYFVNETKAYGFSQDHDMVFETNDGGKTWKTIHFNLPNHIRVHISQIYFYNKDIGYMAGAGGFFLTTKNGGETWEAQNESMALNDLNSICAINSSEKIIVGDYGSVYKLKDGNYQQININSTEHLTSVSFADETHGVITATNGYIYTTSDGGTNWKSQKLSQYKLNKALLKGDKGIVCGDRGTIYSTSDKGNTWKDISYTNTSWGVPYHIVTGEMLNGDTIFVLGTFEQSDGIFLKYYSILIKSYDGGRTWTEQTLTDDRSLWNFAIKKISSNTILIYSGYLCFKSTDNGNTWKHIAYMTDFINSVYLTSSNEVYATSPNGLNKIKDNGYSWDKIYNAPSDVFLRDLCIKDSDTILIGNNGLLLSNTQLNNQLQTYPLTINEGFLSVSCEDTLIFSAEYHATEISVISNLELFAYSDYDWLPGTSVYFGKLNIVAIENVTGADRIGHIFIRSKGIGPYSKMLTIVQKGATSTGIEQNNSKIQIFPNPASKQITISGLHQSGIVMIFTMEGKLVKQQTIANNNLDVSDLPKGMYIIKIITDNKEVYSSKIMKE